MFLDQSCRDVCGRNYAELLEADALSFTLSLSRRSIVLLNTSIEGHVRKKEHRDGDTERVEDRASASKSSA